MNKSSENNLILFPIEPENQKYIENVCTNGGYNFKTFLEHLLNLYKKSLNEPLNLSPESSFEPKKEEKKKKK